MFFHSQFTCILNIHAYAIFLENKPINVTRYVIPNKDHKLKKMGILPWYNSEKTILYTKYLYTDFHI